jgi:two-component system, NarL family, sensor histidine kinase ComP
MRKKYLTIFFFLLFIAIRTWFMYVSFSYPYSGINLEQNKSNDWVIKQFDMSEAASVFDLQVGDYVKKVNNKETGNYSSVQKWRTLDQFKTLLIERKGKLFEVVSPKHTYIAAKLLNLAFLGEIVSFVMALLLFIKMHSKSAQFLSLVFLNIGIVFMSLSVSIRGDLLGRVCINAGVMLVPVLFLHFLIVMLREKANLTLPTRFLKYLYIPIVVSACIELICFNVNMAAYYVYYYSAIATMLYFTVGLLLNLLLIAYIYIKHRKEKTYASIMIKIVWFALCISFSPLAVFSFLPKLLYGYEWINSSITGWAVLFLPISFAYLIATKQLYDIDTIMRRISLTTLISIVPSGFIVGVISTFLPKEDLAILGIIFVLILTVFSIVLYSLEYISTKLEIVMFPRKHQLKKALKKISKNMETISNMRELKEIILVDIVQTLQVVGGAIVFQYRHEIELITEGKIDLTAIEKVLPMYGSDSEESDYTVFPINHHEEYSSYLIMTRKKTNTHLNLEEKQWLGLIITYLAVSLENLYLIRKLTMKLHELAEQIPDDQAAQDFVWFRKIMFELQEKERVRIAMDLHDTTMQDLYFLKGKIESFMKKYALAEADDRKLASIYDYIEIINSNLRQSCFELYPHLLQEIGLIETIRQVIEQEEIGFPFTLQFISKGASAIEESGLEAKRHMFRIFQELLNNAKKHSQASKVKIELAFRKDYVYFIYEDDGVGFEKGRLTAKEINSSGNGIEQLKSRAIYLNGRFELETDKGKGVKMQIILPKEGLTA